MRIFVIDSNRLFREGLRELLAGTAFDVVAEAPSVDGELPMLNEQLPDLVLLELEGGQEQPAERIRRVRAMFNDAKIVVLANRLSPETLSEALGAGADGYLLKNMSIEALTQSLNLVLIGEKVFPTQLAEFLIGVESRPAHSAIIRPLPHIEGLSDREVAILRCLANGDPNRAIADRLRLTEASVKVHLKAVLRKIQVTNRTQAAIWAINNGFHSESASMFPAMNGIQDLSRD